MGDTREYFNRIEEAMVKIPKPGLFHGRESRIICCDCESTSVVPWHFMYHKCEQCKGFNTRVIEN